MMIGNDMQLPSSVKFNQRDEEVCVETGEESGWEKCA